MNKKDNDFKFSPLSLICASYSAGLVIELVSSGSEELSFIDFFKFSFLYLIFGMVLVSIGLVLPSVLINETENKWWARIKLLGIFIGMAFAYYMIAGYLN